MAGGIAIPCVRPVAAAVASPPVLTPLVAIARPRSRIIPGVVAWTRGASRRATSAREGGSGWIGGDTVRPVRTREPLLGASAGSSRSRVGVSVRLTTRPGAGWAGALTLRRRVGTAGRTGALAITDRPG